MDVVYFYVNDPPSPVPKEDVKELKYSLRSIEQNLPHDKVWFVGDKPDWVQNVKHIPVEQKRCGCYMGKFFDISHKFIKLAEYAGPKMSDDIIHMDDDMFVMKRVEDPYTDVNGWFIRTLEQASNRRPDVYGQFLWVTKRFLEMRGFEKPLHMAAHMPCRMTRSKLPIQWYDGQHALEWKSVHLNVNDDLPKHMYAHEVKLGTTADLRLWQTVTPAEYLSTENTTFKIAGVKAYLDEQFPEKSRYEK